MIIQEILIKLNGPLKKDMKIGKGLGEKRSEGVKGEEQREVGGEYDQNAFYTCMRLWENTLKYFKKILTCLLANFLDPLTRSFPGLRFLGQ